MQKLIEFDQALKTLLVSIDSNVGTTKLNLSECLGRILAEDVTSLIDIPGFDNSQVDGYAARSSEVSEGKEFVVSQRIPAGSNPTSLEKGTVARIFTGAEPPSGSDCIIMQEDVKKIGDQKVELLKSVEVGENIRKRACDLKTGEVFFKKGRQLSSADLGLCASVGKVSMQVYEKITVGVFSTGDELKQPGEKLERGQLFDSNRPMILNCVKNMGINCIDFGCLPDRLEPTMKALKSASEKVDAIITCGGVSVGEEDHLKDAVKELGELKLWKINMKPGKPFAFGKLGKSAYLGLPGNPVSAWVTFSLLCRPFILKLNGKELGKTLFTMARTNFDYENINSRREFLRVTIDSTGNLQLYARQNSQILSSICFCDGLIEVDPKQTIKAGDNVKFYNFSSIG